MAKRVSKFFLKILALNPWSATPDGQARQGGHGGMGAWARLIIRRSFIHQTLFKFMPFPFIFGLVSRYSLLIFISVDTGLSSIVFYLSLFLLCILCISSNILKASPIKRESLH